MEPLFIGLDSSTQALKASLLNGHLSVISEAEIRFDRDLPHYGTNGGTLLGPSGSGIVYSPIMQIIEAIDLLFEKLRSEQWSLDKIRGISAAGQQHASVYWSLDAEKILANVKPEESLVKQMKGAFSRQQVPNWQDSSTIEECKELEKAFGGPSDLAKRTGSRAHARFTGPQIMRFKQTEPENYRNTSRISLVSSCITTMLCLDGEIKGIDESDACGMNIWNMSEAERGWEKLALEAIAGKEGKDDLEKKLGKVEIDGGRVVGYIGDYFIKKFGFSSNCIVCPGTGDNPATFLSFTLKEKEALVSLGTSDTVLVSTSLYNPDPEYHAFFHPAQTVKPTKQKEALKAGSDRNDKRNTMRYFNMLVYKNGSLARETIRDAYFDSSWDAFNAAVEEKRLKKADDVLKQTGFYWIKSEIIPANATGTFRYSRLENHANAEKVDEFADNSTNAVAILESQMINYRSRISAILGSADDDVSLKRVYATGGAASNPLICSVMADVFGSNVCKPVVYDKDRQKWKNADWNACSVAAAYKAAWSWYRHSADSEEGRWIDFDAFVEQCSKNRQKERNSNGSMMKHEALTEEGVAIVARPDEQRAKAYSNSIEWWKSLERRALQESQAIK